MLGVMLFGTTVNFPYNRPVPGGFLHAECIEACPGQRANVGVLRLLYHAH